MSVSLDPSYRLLSIVYWFQFKLFLDAHYGADSFFRQLCSNTNRIALAQIADNILVLFLLFLMAFLVTHLSTQPTPVLDVPFSACGKSISNVGSFKFGAGAKYADEDVKERVLGSIGLEDVQVLFLKVDVDVVVFAELHVGQHLINIPAQSVEGVYQ